MRTKTKNIWKIVGLVLGLGVLGAQAWPVDRSNPEVTGDIAHIGEATPEVHAILKKACYDCHSNETLWPWYSYVAPVSWWVADHVHEGRREFNFSIWDQYSDGVRRKLLREAWHEIEEGKMPLDEYLWTHSEAKLSQAELATLKAWITEKTQRPGEGAGDGGGGHDEDEGDEHGEDEDEDDDD